MGGESFSGSSDSLLEIARSVVDAELAVEEVLANVVAAACRLTGARYGALGVLDESGNKLARFITVGVDADSRRAIGSLPTGHGVLGELIRDPRPLRLPDIGRHPRSYGFPAGHPEMHTFLGAPIVVGGHAFGNVYLSEKLEGGEFSQEDEDSLVILASFAGAAIDRAQRLEAADAQRTSLERAVSALQASEQIGRALGTETDVSAVLELVAKRGRALVDARLLVIERLDADELVVVAAAGELPGGGVVGQRLGLAGTVASEALRTRRTQHLDDERNRRRFRERGAGRLGIEARCGLVVPLVFRDQGLGVLLVVDRVGSDESFSDDDQRLVEAFAASAATALATAHSVTVEREQQRIAAGEEERARWARELHDETLQGLASVKMMLGTSLRGASLDEDSELARTLNQTLAQLDVEISTLRALISELRPLAVEERGLADALQQLRDRLALRHGLEPELTIDLSRTDGHPQHAITAYRIIQEALTNAHKHGQATTARVLVTDHDGIVHLTISDDGVGFDPATNHSGFGLLGMRERVHALDGQIEIASTPGAGTTVEARLPLPS